MMTKIAFAILAVAFIAVAVTFWQGDRYAEFMKSADKASALILKKEERIAEPKTKRKEYWVTYQYTTKDGSTHATQELLEYPDIWQNLREGQSTPIYVNRNKPSESHLAAAIERRLGMVQELKR